MKPVSQISHLERMINPYKPQMDIEKMVIEINKIFHRYDAKLYDSEHPEIFEQLPDIYSQMCMLLPKKTLRVLNFGCGTGFEAEQILRNIPEVELLVCYDISNEMLGLCRQKLNGRRNILFVDKLEEIPPNMQFDLLLTNSLLHHLPNPIKTIQELTKHLSQDSYYIMGHEGSARFYKNTEFTKKGTRGAGRKITQTICGRFSI